MKATKLLKEQHREVEDLFSQVLESEDSDEQREGLEQISAKLEAHMAIEEQIFYPAVRSAVETKKIQEMIPEAYEEHHVVKLVLAEMPQVDPGDAQFKAKVTVLKELIEHHVKEEEKDLFKAAEKLGEQRLSQLGQQMEAMFAEEKETSLADVQDEQHME